MSDEPQREIDRLKAENTKLLGNIESLTADLKEVRGEARDRRHENKSLAEQLAALAAERDGYKVKAEVTPKDLTDRIEQLTVDLRTTKHERAYEKVAKTLKVNDPAKYADLLKLAGHTPDSDEPDEARIAETFQAALKGRPWLVDAEPTKPAPGGAPTAPGGANGATEVPKPAVPGPGSDRGQSVTSTASQLANRPAGRL